MRLKSLVQFFGGFKLLIKRIIHYIHRTTYMKNQQCKFACAHNIDIYMLSCLYMITVRCFDSKLNQLPKEGHCWHWQQVQISQLSPAHGLQHGICSPQQLVLHPVSNLTKG